MRTHDNRDIPDARYRGKWNCDTACYRCGAWDSCGSSTDCDKIFADGSMARYQVGGDLDPFAGYRDDSSNDCVTDEDERRPGLIAETIDREAYDAFMKGLG